MTLHPLKMNLSESSELTKGGAYGAARRLAETNAGGSLNTHHSITIQSGRGAGLASGLSKPHAPGFSRKAFLRILRVASEIRNRQQVTVAEIAAEMECCHRTIYRDIDFLKNVGAPINFNYGLNTWVWNPLLPTPWYFGGEIKKVKIL